MTTNKGNGQTDSLSSHEEICASTAQAYALALVLLVCAMNESYQPSKPVCKPLKIDE